MTDTFSRISKAKKPVTDQVISALEQSTDDINASFGS